MGEALELIQAASQARVPLKLVGGLAVRHLCPGFPPREREGQDLDLASASKARTAVTELLIGRGYEPDQRFNALYGHKQLYFVSSSGRSVDVVIDRIQMCHVVEFADRIDRMPHTLDVVDVLLSKLQIVELNEKDVQDVLYLLAAFPVVEGDEPGAVGLDRIRDVVADDWGWWRTLTGNIEQVHHLATGDVAHLIPAGARHDVLGSLGRVLDAAHDVPKTLRWKLRAKVGERRRWYERPEEIHHD
jgi:hypothetical protein